MYVATFAIATGKDTVYFPFNHADIDLSLDKKLKLWDL